MRDGRADGPGVEGKKAALGVMEYPETGEAEQHQLHQGPVIGDTLVEPAPQKRKLKVEGNGPQGAQPEDRLVEGILGWDAAEKGEEIVGEGEKAGKVPRLPESDFGADGDKPDDAKNQNVRRDKVGETPAKKSGPRRGIARGTEQRAGDEESAEDEEKIGAGLQETLIAEPGQGRQFWRVPEAVGIDARPSGAKCDQNDGNALKEIEAGDSPRRGGITGDGRFRSCQHSFPPGKLPRIGIMAFLAGRSRFSDSTCLGGGAT